ncbi:hypothetical protein A2635_03275 [Candidatus Peribacteria bacterium RIFCSPHIGHO2_01_FULL_51_9]|nr:MAG: hypothetical protein A2635_03275 [Candidatus Peribacteria bacterium RIFCSPHIGHO2_01_FULL_51_9]
MLALVNGTFSVESSEFFPTFLLLLPGLILFFILSQSGRILSRREGLALLTLYAAFLIAQSLNIMHIIPKVEGQETLKKTASMTLESLPSHG